MVVTYRLGTSEAMDLFVDSRTMTPAEWLAFTEERGLLAFAAEEGGDLVGLALAESGPKAVHVLTAEGRPDACLALLQRLVRLAGKRDVTMWCHVEKHDLKEMLVGLGFTEIPAAEAASREAYFYRLRREGD